MALGNSFLIRFSTQGLGIILGPFFSPVWTLTAILPSIFSLTLLYILSRPSAERSLVKYTIDSGPSLLSKGIYMSPSVLRVFFPCYDIYNKFKILFIY